jgi:putative membrane protein
MTDSPYNRFANDELILRDELAIDRTLLANERTMLSYVRGAISLVIAGLTFEHFVDHGALRYLGLSLVPLGVISGLYGLIRSQQMAARIQVVRNTTKLT